MWTLIIIAVVSAGNGGGVHTSSVDGFHSQALCMSAGNLMAASDATPELRMAKTVVKTYCLQTSA